jgi:hypothetical protein
MSFIEIVEEQETFEHAVGGSTLVLRRFDSEVYRDIEKRHTKRHKNLRQGGWIEEQDSYAINADLLDYMVVDWKDVRSPSTKEDVPCTRENKLKLPNSVKIEILDACDADSITGGGSDEGQKKTKPSGSS